MIFAPTTANQPTACAPAPTLPVVLIDRTGPPGLHDGVVLDTVAACTALVDHLVERGVSRIGGLFGSTSSDRPGAPRRLRGREARHGLAPRPARCCRTPSPPRRRRRAGLAEPGRPAALIVSNGLLLMGPCAPPGPCACRCPGDLALAGFDNEPCTDLVEPGLTVVEQPVDEIAGSDALLFDRLSARTTGAPGVLAAAGGAGVAEGIGRRAAPAPSGPRHPPASSRTEPKVVFRRPLVSFGFRMTRRTAPRACFGCAPLRVPTTTWAIVGRLRDARTPPSSRVQASACSLRLTPSPAGSNDHAAVAHLEALVEQRFEPLEMLDPRLALQSRRRGGCATPSRSAARW